MQKIKLFLPIFIFTLFALAHQVGASLTVGSTSINTDGALAINGVAGSVYTLGAATTSGTITIGGTAQTGNLVMGQSSATNDILIGTGSGSATIQMASGNTGSNVIIGQTTTWNGAKVDIRQSQTSAFTAGLSVYADRRPTASGSNASTAVNFTTSSHGSGINYSGYLNTLQLEADAYNTGTLGTLENLYLYTYNSNSSAILTTYGIFNVMQSDTGTLTSAYLINNDLTVNGGTISNAYQVYNGNPAGAGTITNNYSLYIAGQTKGTNNVGIVVGEATGTKQTNVLIGTTTQPIGSYSIYNSSADPNYFAGDLGIGLSANQTGSKLEVKDGHYASSQTTAPTGTTGTCTSDSVSGTDSRGVITGTCNNQTLIVAFNIAYASAPVCVVSPTNAAAAAGARESYTTSTSALTITVPGNITAGTWSYVCMQ